MCLDWSTFRWLDNVCKWLHNDVDKRLVNIDWKRKLKRIRVLNIFIKDEDNRMVTHLRFLLVDFRTIKKEKLFQNDKN